MQISTPRSTGAMASRAAVRMLSSQTICKVLYTETFVGVGVGVAVGLGVGVAVGTGVGVAAAALFVPADTGVGVGAAVCVFVRPGAVGAGVAVTFGVLVGLGVGVARLVVEAEVDSDVVAVAELVTGSSETDSELSVTSDIADVSDTAEAELRADASGTGVCSVFTSHDVQDISESASAKDIIITIVAFARLLRFFIVNSPLSSAVLNNT